MRDKLSRFVKGKHFSPKTEFKKGHVPWCAGTTGLLHHSEESKKKIIKTLIGNKRGWKGGRIKQYGYILIFSPKHPFANSLGYVREHRLVVEAQIGRYLTPEETVHHKRKIDDNRPHMLMAFSSDSAHHRFHHNPNNVKPEEIIFDGLHI